ncbi:MAG: dihydrofolate reductase, partial [Bacteroidota bacterium]
MLISMIAAVGENLELGASNELLWHLPDDFAWFIKHTKGKPVIMGRKTMESLGKPLKGRTNIVLTSRDEVLPGFEPAKDWEIAINLANIAIEQKQALALEAGEVVIGDPE